MIRILALILGAGAAHAGLNGEALDEAPLDADELPYEEPTDMLPYEDLMGPGLVEFGPGYWAGPEELVYVGEISPAHEALIYDLPEPPPTPELVGIDPTTPDYERVFEEAYREPLRELRDYRVAVRKRIGIIQPEYVPPPMPREARGRR